MQFTGAAEKKNKWQEKKILIFSGINTDICIYAGRSFETKELIMVA